MTQINNGFLSWPLHDAVLHRITIDWQTYECVFELSVFWQRDRKAEASKIVFGEVKDIKVPHSSPWGKSVCVNGQKIDGGLFVIEMQSGDEIAIDAKTASIERN